MTEGAPSLLDPKMLARLRAWPLRARRTVEGTVAGAHRSPFRGFSTEFAEHCNYTPGDDLRHLDWKVFGRTDKYYLKRFEEETNLTCWLAVDVSESMGYQSHSAAMSKLDYARRAAAAMAHLVLHRQDSVGLVAFDREIRRFVRPGGNPAHLNKILRGLKRTSAERGRKTSIGPILHELAERWKRRGVVIVLSDFFDDTDAILAGLRHLRHRRHDVAAMHVLDPAEVDFSFGDSSGTLAFRGLEDVGDAVVDPAAVRRAYCDEFGRFCRRLQAGCRDASVDYVSMRTDRSLEAALAEFLRARSR